MTRLFRDRGTTQLPEKRAFLCVNLIGLYTDCISNQHYTSTIIDWAQITNSKECPPWKRHVGRALSYESKNTSLVSWLWWTTLIIFWNHEWQCSLPRNSFISATARCSPCPYHDIFYYKVSFFFFYNFLRIAFIKISLCLYILINFEEGSVSFLTSDNGTVLMTVPKCFACGK